MVTGSDQLDALGLLTIPTGSATAGAVMAGYDGHRGWIYSIAVHPDHRKKTLAQIYFLLFRTNYLYWDA